MANIQLTLCALGALSLTASLAQQPAPIAPPITQTTATGAPAGGTTVETTSVGTAASESPGSRPAVIEPPLTFPAVPPPPAPGTVAPELSAPVSNGGLAPTTSRLNEFQGDEISLVLRSLARQAKINIVVSDKVATTAGLVTMRIEDRTPREAIDVIVASKGLVLDELNGVFFVKTQEERLKEPTDSASFTLNYAQAKDILPLLQTQLTSGLVPQFDQRTNTLFYREAKSNMDKIALFLETIDKPTRQVMIEARLVEVNANPKQSYGINWAGVVGGSATPQTFRYGGSVANPTAASQNFPQPTNGGVPNNAPINSINFDPQTGKVAPADFALGGFGAAQALSALGGQFAILSLPQMSATMRLLNEDSDTEFLANPRIVTANNQKAEIKITRAQPVPQLNFNEQTAQAVFSGFQEKEFGNTLTVTPSINKADFISLMVKPEISNKVGDAQFTFGGATVLSPIIDRRTLDSNVLIKSGDTLAIGGLLQDEQTKASSKVPILGDIPFLGYLFQEKLNSRTKRNLLIFVTPTVIKQGYGTGLESQVNGLTHSGEEFADPNGWRNNAKGAVRLKPTSHRQLSADAPKPGVAKAPLKLGYKVNATTRE